MIIYETEYQDCPPSDSPDFLRLAERLEAGELPRHAVKHLTRKQMNYLSRMLGGCRPLLPWIEDTGPAVVAATIRSFDWAG